MLTFTKSQLRNYIRQNKYILYYQPIINLKTLKVVGVEALVRLIFNGQVLSPATFLSDIQSDIELNQEFELYLLQLLYQDIQVIQEVCPNIEINFNLSANHLSQPNTYANIIKILFSRQLLVRVNLEVTEQTSITSQTNFNSNIQQLAQFFSIFLDDFGTGFCNINYLLQYPIKGIKIDRFITTSVINHCNYYQIIEAFIKNCIQKDLEVIIEGIETEEQLIWAKKLQCIKGQGYYWSKPVPLKTFLKMINQ